MSLTRQQRSNASAAAPEGSAAARTASASSPTGAMATRAASPASPTTRTTSSATRTASPAPRSAPAPRGTHLGQAALALLALGGLVVGVPALLSRLAAALPVPAVGDLLSGYVLRADDGGLLLAALLLIAWVAWAAVVGCVIVEVVAVVRRAPSPRLPGLALPQNLAGWLVAGVLLAVVPATSVKPAAALAWDRALPHATAVQEDPSFGAEQRAVTQDDVGRSAVLPTASESTEPRMPLPVVLTQRHDTLWLLAEQHLRAGERFEEILALNLGVTQPDGRALARDGRVYPGWELRLPADATVEAHRPARVVVEPGDTLWDLAEEELGDPRRYREVFAENRGDLQPDGQRLTRAELIKPGWVLTMPATEAADGGSAAATPTTTVAPGDGSEDVAEGAPAGVLDRGPAPVIEGQGQPSENDSVGEVADGDRAVSALQGAQEASGDLPILDRGTGTDARSGRDQPGQSSASGSRAPHDSGVRGLGAATEDSEIPSLDRAESPPRQPAVPGTGAFPDTDAVPDAGAVPDTNAGAARDVSAPSLSGEESAGGSARGAASWAVPREESAGGAAGSARAPEGTPQSVSEPADTSGGGSLPDVDRTAATLAESSLGPAGSTLTAFLLGAVAAELTRRRRRFQRVRRPGERMAPPTAGQAELEAALRTTQADESADLLEPALRALARSARDAGRRFPRVRVVLASAGEVTLLLAGDEPPLVPFVPAGERRWSLDSDQLADLPDAATSAAGDEGADEDILLPALVTLGVDGQTRVLVDLAEVGTLSLAGSAEAVRPAVRGLAAELVFGRPRAGAERLVCSPTSPLVEAAGPGEVALETAPERVGAAVRAVLAGNGAGVPDPLDPPLVVLAEAPIPVAVAGRSGVGLITTGHAREASASLVLEADGTAALLPEGIRLRAQVLSAAGEADLVGLIAATDLPPDLEAGARDAAEVVALLAEPTAARGGSKTPSVAGGVLGARSGQPGIGGAIGLKERSFEIAEALSETAEALSAQAVSAQAVSVSAQVVSAQAVSETAPAVQELAPQAAPTILLLGELRVVDPGGPAESTRIGRLAETAAFVLLNPGARPSELQAALWPQRRSNPQTCRQMISRTRTWLGRTEAGESYLEPFTATEGRLCLRPEVGSDWQRFQDLADAGFADPQDTAALSAALRLVRGRPFGSVVARELPWADLHINEMLCLITDVAHDLALRYESAGQYGAARDAVLRGLRTQTESQLLTADLARLRQHG